MAVSKKEYLNDFDLVIKLKENNEFAVSLKNQKEWLSYQLIGTTKDSTTTTININNRNDDESFIRLVFGSLDQHANWLFKILTSEKATDLGKGHLISLTSLAIF